MGMLSMEPNRLLVETVANLPPGRALDIAMGEGRNSVFLAMKGWQVTGFDVSDEALRQAQARAARAGVKIETIRMASGDFDYGRDQWDLILLSYALAPLRDPNYVQRLHDSLRPGGRVVFEHYLRSARRAPGMPERGELPRLFAGFKLLRYEETVMQSDWTFRSKAALARMVAAKQPGI